MNDGGVDALWGRGVTIASLAAVSHRVVDEPWQWADASRDLIDRHWRAALERTPQMFNGKVLLSRRPVIANGRYEAECLPVDFAAFLAWRDLGWPDASMVNFFSMAALRASDGPWIAGVQAAHTANAGKIYFAAGTPDMQDVLADGRVDLEGSMHRELAEETGVDAADLEFASGWRAVFDGGRVALMREARSALPANMLVEQIRHFIAGEVHSELADVHVIGDAGAIDPIRMQPFMCAWLDAEFETGAGFRPGDSGGAS